VIEAEKATYPIAWMCRLLGVPRSSFYQWRIRVETPTRARRRELAGHVRRVFDDSRQTSGCRRVAAQLNRDGVECSVGLVADLMRELGLKACQPRAYKRTTIPGEQPHDSPDLIGREFTAGAPGQRLVGLLVGLVHHHALGEHAGERLIQPGVTGHLHGAGEEARIEQVQDRVLDAADVLVDRHHAIRDRARGRCVLVPRIGEAREVPRGVDERVHRVGFARRFPAALRTGDVLPGRMMVERVAGPIERHVLG